MALSVGSKINFSFTDHTGRESKYPEDFGGKKVAIFFLRHLGCPLCKEKVNELAGKAAAFEAKGMKLLAVVQSTPKRCAEVAAKEKLTYLLVPDREKKLYDLFQVEKGGLVQYMAPSVLKATVRATIKGHMHGKFEGDEFQVPASFVLAGGEIAFAYYGKDISDFGNVEEVLSKA